MPSPPRWRQALPVLVTLQATLGATALVWGLVRDIPWWRALAVTPEVLAALLAGGFLSLASTGFFQFLARRGFSDVGWVLDGFLGPLFRGLPLSWAIGLSLLSGFCEEAFFRGILVPEFGLWASSVLFGLLHTGDRRLALMGLWAGLMGLGMGLAWQITGNLAVPVALHAGCNFLSFVQLARWTEPAPASDAAPGR
jgi:membrane protease YdiL (CAAX protease family)